MVLLTCHQLATALGISESSIRKASTRSWNPLPALRLPGGRAIRYDLDAVLRWMDANDTEASS